MEIDEKYAPDDGIIRKFLSLNEDDAENMLDELSVSMSIDLQHDMSGEPREFGDAVEQCRALRSYFIDKIAERKRV